MDAHEPTDIAMHRSIRAACKAHAWRRSAWARADRAARLQAHGLAWINTLGGTHLHAWGWAGLHALGWALRGTWLRADVDALRGTEIHTLGAAGRGALGGTRIHALGWALRGTRLRADVDALRGTELHALGAAGRGALGGTRLHALGAAGRGALGGTGRWADLHTRCGARLHADAAAAGLHAHRLAGLHALGALLRTNGRGQAGLLALLVVGHPPEVLLKLKAKRRREIQNQDTCSFYLSRNSQPELLQNTQQGAVGPRRKNCICEWFLDSDTCSYHCRMIPFFLGNLQAPLLGRLKT